MVNKKCKTLPLSHGFSRFPEPTIRGKNPTINHQGSNLTLVSNFLVDTFLRSHDLSYTLIASSSGISRKNMWLIPNYTRLTVRFLQKNMNGDLVSDMYWCADRPHFLGNMVVIQ